MSRKVSITYKTHILTGAEPVIWRKKFCATIPVCYTCGGIFVIDYDNLGNFKIYCICFARNTQIEFGNAILFTRKISEKKSRFFWCRHIWLRCCSKDRESDSSILPNLKSLWASRPCGMDRLETLNQQCLNNIPNPGCPVALNSSRSTTVRE